MALLPKGNKSILISELDCLERQQAPALLVVQ